MAKKGGHRTGRVVQTLGRRVLVRDPEGEEHVCYLSGRRAVIGDEVGWHAIKGGGGKLVKVMPRRTVLRRVDPRGREQILAANLGGLLVVGAPTLPTFSPALLDRYLTAGRSDGLEIALCLNKADLGVSDTVREAIALREPLLAGFAETSALAGEGLEPLRAVLARGGPWAFVGHSGVGKTSLIRQLLPEQEVGPVGSVSEYWGTGRHTTSGSRIFSLDGAEIVDSPGIRTFTPGGLDSSTIRSFFPGFEGLECKFRDCLHREGEQGCAAPGEVAEGLIDSYRRLLNEVLEIESRKRPGAG